MSLFSWFAGTRMGQTVILIAAAMAAFFYAVARAFSSGKATEKAKQDKAALEASRNREQVDDDISKMDERRTRSELSRWMRADDA